MRRRQVFKEQQLNEAKMKETYNCNLISDTAQPALKKLASMFDNNPADIMKPNASPYRKGGSKPGAGAYKKTYKKSELKGK